MAPHQTIASEASSPQNSLNEDLNESLRKKRRVFFWKNLPRTTGGILAGIMLSAMIPLLLLQTTIYIFWYKTRIQTEMSANLEFARSVAHSFESYVVDVRRQLVVAGSAIESEKGFSLDYAERLLRVLKDQYSTVLRFSLVDEKGVIIASTNPKAVGISVADRDYVRSVQGGREWTISNLGEGPLADKVYFNIARRTRIGGHNGLIVAVIDPDQLGELVLSAERPAEGTFTLFDRDGNLVFFGGAYPAGHPNWKSSDPVLQKAMKGEEAVGAIIYPLDRKDHLVARVPLGSFGWTAGASRPIEVIMAPIYRNLLWVAVLNGIILVISISSAVGLSRFFIARLDQLRQHARLIAGGDFSSKASFANPAELTDLAQSFNAMADQVQAREQSLQRAIGDLTRSNQELEQFAYIASHDLQEPLRAITGFVQLIEKKYKGQLDKEGDRYIGFVTDAVSREHELIRDLLSYARVGRHTIKLSPVDANMAVDAAAQNIRQTIQEEKASVTRDELPIVQADGVQLVQLFQNLIGNGIKFRGSADPAVHVSAHLADGQWIFAVRDNGLGIEEQYWDQIFTMFKRLHTRKEYPGTGIGLAICKKIVERHGGRIWVDSKPGEGSTFLFTLTGAGA